MKQIVTNLEKSLGKKSDESWKTIQRKRQKNVHNFDKNSTKVAKGW